MGDNIFTTIIEIGAFLIIFLLVGILLLPYLLSFITPYLAYLPLITFIGGIAILFLGIYILNGTIAKMSK